LKRQPAWKVCRSLDCWTASLGEWLGQRRGARSTDAAEQAAIRKRALVAVGSVRGGDSTRAERAGELVREIIYKKHVEESNALARRFGRRTDRQP